MSTHTVITGNIVADPEIKFLESGGCMANFRIASSTKKKDELGNWVNGDTHYFSCVAFGKNAEAVALGFKKGTAAVVTGKLETRQTEKDGMKITYFNVVVETASVDVRQYLRAPEADAWQTSQSPF